MINKKVFFIISILHFFASNALLYASFIDGVNKYNPDGSPIFILAFLNTSITILLAPMYQLLKFAPLGFDPGLLGYVIFYLNSCLWALVLVYVYSKLNQYPLNKSLKSDAASGAA